MKINFKSTGTFIKKAVVNETKNASAISNTFRKSENLVVRPLAADAVDIYNKTHGDIVGTVKIKKRGLNEYVEANIRRLETYDDGCEDVVRYELESNKDTLIYQLCKDMKKSSKTDFSIGFYKECKNGLPLYYIRKTPEGEAFEHLAKIMDMIAVKESSNVGLKGKVSLQSLAESQALHWKRGYKGVDYQTYNSVDKKAYNIRMMDAYNRYKNMRIQGESITDSLKSLTGLNSYDSTMVLPEKIVQKYADNKCVEFV